MTEKYKFLFLPIDAVGHFNACFGLASILRDRNHTVAFAATKKWQEKLSGQGYQQELYDTSADKQDSSDASGDVWGKLLTKVAPVFSLPTIERLEPFYLPTWKTLTSHIQYANPQLKEIMSSFKPDVVIIDNVVAIPAVMNTDVPWISCISITPLGISNENVPPAYSGYPTCMEDKTDWNLFENKVGTVVKDLVHDFNDWLVKNGGKEVKVKLPFFQDPSPYANIYMYPKELDYLPFRPNPPNFYQFDCFAQISNEVFEIPEQLKKRPGKLIYFSMGTIGSADVGLMRRLIGILAKSSHRFIVSKGPVGEQIELADNMWGANSVPQTSVLPVVDLVITHGGNNTVTEAFYFGKRLLVLPITFDQPDNAQRIFETGHGLTFHPYKVTEEELLEGIEILLADELLERRMISISKRIQAEMPQQKASDLIERIAKENKPKGRN